MIEDCATGSQGGVGKRSFMEDTHRKTGCAVWRIVAFGGVRKVAVEGVGRKLASRRDGSSEFAGSRDRDEKSSSKILVVVGDP